MSTKQQSPTTPAPSHIELALGTIATALIMVGAMLASWGLRAALGWDSGWALAAVAPVAILIYIVVKIAIARRFASQPPPSA